MIPTLAQVIHFFPGIDSRSIPALLRHAWWYYRACQDGTPTGHCKPSRRAKTEPRRAALRPGWWAGLWATV